MSRRIRTAVFPVGGFGTRFLPATKSMPKEMLPVIDKPLIHYAVEEAQAAGIEQFIFVTGRGKQAIEDYFDQSYELSTELQKRDAPHDIIEKMVFEPGKVCYLRQQAPLGLGHAVWCARHIVKDEPFAVLLADDLILAEKGCIRQMIEAYTAGNMVAVMEVPGPDIAQYGVLDIQHSDGPFHTAKDIVEKPKASDAPSPYAVIGRYILEPQIFETLDRLETCPRTGEKQLTDALRPSLNGTPLMGYEFSGTRFDCGSKAGLLKAAIAHALLRDDMKTDVVTFIRDLESRGELS